MNNNIEKRLKDINLENRVYIIFIILIILGEYANNKEIDYFLNNNINSKKVYYNIMVFVFIVTTIISGYYFYNSSMDLKDNSYFRKKEYAKLSYIASLFTFIASIMFLYIAITDTEIEAEISL